MLFGKYWLKSDSKFETILSFRYNILILQMISLWTLLSYIFSM